MLEQSFAESEMQSTEKMLVAQNNLCEALKNHSNQTALLVSDLVGKCTMELRNEMRMQIEN
eukprot:5664845-Karenia_brevis.AAC.1